MQVCENIFAEKCMLLCVRFIKYAGKGKLNFVISKNNQ